MPVLTVCSNVSPVARPRGQTKLPPNAINLKRFRELAGLSQEQLDAESGTKAVGMIESGRRPNARRNTLQKLADALSRRLGTTIAVEDLQREPPGGHPPADIINATFQQFMASKPDLSEREAAELLVKTQWPFGNPTVEAWYLAMRLMRISRGDT